MKNFSLLKISVVLILIGLVIWGMCMFIFKSATSPVQMTKPVQTQELMLTIPENIMVQKNKLGQYRFGNKNGRYWSPEYDTKEEMIEAIKSEIWEEVK